MSQGILCFKDRKFSTRTIPAVFNTTCSMPGQYVIYYNERLMNVSYHKKYSPYVQNNLCEVEVYECSPGNYGINCLQKCGECRGKSPCNKINGSCPDGCSAGYIGSLCSEHCKETFYGKNCALKCSKSCTHQRCHHVSGVCNPDEKKRKTKKPTEGSDGNDETGIHFKH
uniref:Scavenger receptor class F member 2 n=1 Tax=Magallana gigas TaxID=29159 RepID=K1QJT4_MAGGI